jgi:hypothetical protein
VVEANALVADVTTGVRTTVAVTNAIIAFWRVFIVMPRTESAQYPPGASFHSSSDSHRWDDERDFRPRRETRKLSTADLCNKRFLASLKPSEAFLARLPLVIPGSVAAILR